ncbi:MAG: flagellar biosynthesis protein FlgE, partial [Gammaproteobacteria bacterium]|nr:flagellar biosynthesis protein FlgE [Gammaproteobacteria bacterium]
MTQGTVYRKFAYDMLSDPIKSTPASLNLKATSPDDVAALSLAGGSNGLDLSNSGNVTRAELRNLLQISVDGSDFINIVPSGAATGPMISPEELAFAMNKYFAGGYNGGTAPAGTGGRTYGDIQVEYDFARQALRITQTGDDTIHLSSDAAIAGELFGATNLALGAGDVRNDVLATVSALNSADGDAAVVLTASMVPAGDLIAEQRNQRYGVEVNFLDGAFVFSSGTTGDGSSIAIRNVATVVDAAYNTANSTTFDIGTAATASTVGERLFGLTVEAGTPESENTVSVAEALSAVANRPAVRGQASTPAIVQGNQMGIDPSKPFEVSEDNRSLTVIVDNISAQILLDVGQYSVGDFTTEVESKINLMADKLGRQVSGVRVEFDAETSSLRFTGSTATDDSFLQVAGSADFGLEDVEPAFGTNSSYIRLSPDTQGTTPLYVYQDRNGEWLETTDKGTFDENDIPNWSPIFLDRGELTFDTSGTL